MPDLTVSERWLLAPVILVIFAVGLYPQLIAGVLQGTVTRFIVQVRF
jgi:NADH-quinone oxidoreductase subunit M